MTFLAPAALIGTLLLAIPILVHLFKPRKMKATPFSSLRWLEQTHQRLSRRIQWHQWLLFCARAGILLLLVLALARPLFGTSGEAGAVDRIIVLDAGRGMAYQSPGLPTPWDNARALATQLMEKPRPGQRHAVILVDGQARLLAPLAPDVSPVIRTLQDKKPGLATAELGSAFPLVQALLAGADDAKRGAELVILTDNQAAAWNQRELHELAAKIKRPLKVQVIDVGLGRPANAWIAGARLLPTGPNEEKALLIEIGAAGGEQSQRTLKLGGIAGLTEEGQPLTPQSDRLVRVLFRLPAETKVEGQVAQLTLEPHDGLASDDIYHLPLETTPGCRVLLIAPETPGGDGRHVNVFLRSGLEALRLANKEAVQITARTPEAATVDDMNQADVVFLASCADLPQATLDKLEARVRGGAGLVAWLGPKLSAAFVNERLHRPAQPSEGLSPLKLGPSSLVRPGQPSTLTNLRWRHPVLAGLNDPVLGDWTQGLFTQYAKLEGDLGQGDQVLATFEDGTPALVEHAMGAGRVLLINTSANDEWSDLPRKQSFVPLLDRLISYLGPGGGRRVFAVGEPATLALPETAKTPAVEITMPAGEKVVPRVTPRGGRNFVSVEDTSEAGIYRITLDGNPAPQLQFVVNAGRGGSNLSSMDAEALKAWWAPIPVDVIDGGQAGQRWQGGGASWPLWPLLVVLGIALLAVETVYAAWLCPGRQPTLASSIIHGRGLLKPPPEPSFNR